MAKLTPCPCCGARLKTLPLEKLIPAAMLSEMQARILRPLWAAKGEFVPTERLLDIRYADDPDGGPEGGRNSFQYSLRRLRQKLEPFGVRIVSQYQSGYRVVFDRP